MQGDTATCYLIQALAGGAEFPAVIRSIFGTQQALNPDGIYSLRLYIRGKPWTVVVDDLFVFEDRRSGRDRYRLRAARVGDDRSLWAPIVEKAWAKVAGTYFSADYGLIKNGIRVLTGAPVFGYFLSPRDSVKQRLEDFDEIQKAGQRGYIVGVQTSGGSDSTRNKFGVANGHAFSVLAAFPLLSREGTVEHRLYMIRDPWSMASFNGKWSSKAWRRQPSYAEQVIRG